LLVNIRYLGLLTQIVEIDLAKVEAKVIDLTSDAAPLKGRTAKNWAKKSEEMLVEGVKRCRFIDWATRSRSHRVGGGACRPRDKEKSRSIYRQVLIPSDAIKIL
jgi:hypothetical protein